MTVTENEISERISEDINLLLETPKFQEDFFIRLFSEKLKDFDLTCEGYLRRLEYLKMKRVFHQIKKEYRRVSKFAESSLNENSIYRKIFEFENLAKTLSNGLPWGSKLCFNHGTKELLEIIEKSFKEERKYYKENDVCECRTCLAHKEILESWRKSGHYDFCFAVPEVIKR